MKPKVKVWAGIAAAGLIAAGLAFGTGAPSGDVNSVQAGMSGLGAKGGAPAGGPNGGKPSGGIAQTSGGNGI